MDNQIIKTDFADVMRKSYIDYAMSVIVARAIPDVRDGLKPVQRRTLYDMYELGIKYDKPFRKSARIVGDTMGKYHPHGDSSIYESLVVMSQDFKKGLPLVDGHGNFGSIEGDGAAAMRYTEARLKKVTQEAYLADLDKGVVDFVPNFDETEKEPEVLPVKIPNFLVNGSEGIAVGMVTSTPPHNLAEVIDAEIAYMKKPSISTEELLEIMKGPDFPTGGIVVNKDELLSIYETGVGKIKIRGKVEVENDKGGKKKLVITEIPYTMIGANIGKFLNDICTLIDKRQLTDVIDISNQSSKEGIRIVLELKKTCDVEKVKNVLYKKTRLEDTFGVNMLAVANKRPETLGLKDVLKYNVDFQFETAGRKYTTLLAKEREKSEIQDGLIKAVDVIDLIIEILRGSKSVADVKACLIDGVTDNINFKSEKSKVEASWLRFTPLQAQAILDMRLQKLIGLELEALIKDHETTLKNIALYEDILNNPKVMAKVIIKDLEAIKKEFGIPRRTAIENAAEIVIEEEKIEECDVFFLMDRFGYCKCVDETTYERNKEAADSENKYVLKVKNTDKICLFTSAGMLHSVKVSDIVFGRFREKGTPIENVSTYDGSKEDLLCICGMNDLKGETLIYTTASGMMKQVEADEFIVGKRSVAATKLADDDRVVSVEFANQAETVVLITANSFFLRFAAGEIPVKKKGAIGVRAIKLGAGDYVKEVHLLGPGSFGEIEYDGKMIAINRMKISKRDAKGTKR